MSDALPIAKPVDCAGYDALVRQLVVACAAHDDAAIDRWAKQAIALATRQRPAVASDCGDGADDRAAHGLAARWRRLHGSAAGAATCTQSTAAAFLAREHGFDGWDALQAHLAALRDPASPIARFEAAADAVVSGRLADLSSLLDADASLVHARSDREHRSTLLHYVAANGIEDFRQQTPANIIEIARRIIDAGADVNATSAAYGGGATTLGLAATSLHPQRAGVQIALLDLLLAHGAYIERPGAAGNGHGAVLGCLANGQSEAAAFLAARGARLTLVEAAGIGRLESVEALLASDASLLDEIQSAFQYACGYGHVAAATLLLAHSADAALPADKGETPLHWAAGGLHPGAVDLLLQRGAPVEAREATWEATPLEWALYGWSQATSDEVRSRGRETIAKLLAAGATFRKDWPGDALTRRMRADTELAAMLRLDPQPPG